MRLIDADELPMIRIVETVDTKNKTFTTIGWVADSVIYNAPTIDAIPVEFIKNKLETYHYIWEHSSPKVEKQYQAMYNAIQSLLWDWEKENE